MKHQDERPVAGHSNSHPQTAGQGYPFESATDRRKTAPPSGTAGRQPNFVRLHRV